MKNNKFNFISIAIVMATCFTSWAQHDNNKWSIKAGGNLSDHSKAMSVDKDGNIYITGGFQSTAAFGDKKAQAIGDTDIFVAKYDKAGQLIWSTQAGSNTYINNVISECGTDILVNNNAIYVTGFFLEKAQFDNQEINSNGSDDIFLAKYDLNGKLLWIKSAGGKSQDIPYSLAADKSGNIYLTGSFQKEAQFGNQTVTALNSTEMFLAKYNIQGDLVWVKQSFSQKPALGKVVKCQDDYCMVAGEFDGLLNLSETKLIANSPNVFVAQYSLDGEVLAATQLKGQSDATVKDILLERNQIFLTGSFSESIDFNDKQVSSNGSRDVYLAKLDTKFNIIDMNSFGGTYLDEATKIFRINENEIGLIGNFQGSISINDNDFNGNGASDCFIFHLSNEGVFKKGEIFGGSGQDQVDSALYFGNHIYTTGFFRESMIVNNQEISSNGLSDIMIIKHDVSSGSKEKLSNIPKIYPNPSNDHFFVESNDNILSVTVYSLLGRVVFEKDNVNLKNYKVGLEGAPSGVYIIKTTTENNSFENKLLIERQ
jgi:hypothetical protein